ncbi:MAG: YceH family protein [Bacteroidetes bacterium]|nr:YceH family protein [Bacteroidota bacterium]
MMEKLSSLEIRILGSLIEKSLTTPEYYPMTPNALTNACNQKSNRNPVTDYSESDVMNGLSSLMQKGFAGKVISEGARVVKYRYVLPYPFMLNERELPLMCVLLLRGAQTSGELRTRTDRMYDFRSLDEVEEALQRLQERETGALVKTLERMPGQKESRVIHLMGDSDAEQSYSVNEKKQSDDKIKQLEHEITGLKEHISTIEEKLNNFIKQFE